MVNVPVRAGPVFGSAMYWTAPPPAPDAPAVTRAQGTFALAVHEQPACAVTATLPPPPAAGAVAEFGAIEYEQPLACVIVKVSPPIVRVPDRAAPAFASVVYWT